MKKKIFKYYGFNKNITIEVSNFLSLERIDIGMIFLERGYYGYCVSQIFACTSTNGASSKTNHYQKTQNHGDKVHLHSG